MDRFGFLIHPVDIKQSRSTWPILKFVPAFLIKFFLIFTPPFIFSNIKCVRSSTGAQVSGCFILCPLLPEQMIKLDEKFVTEKIIKACKLAEKTGARIVGLGGYTSVVGDKGYTIAKRLSIPVTTGNTLTTWSVIRAITDLASEKNVDLRRSTLAVIGASGSIGSLCARKLSSSFGKMIIVARRKEKLEQLRKDILSLNDIDVVIDDDIKRAAKAADFVIITTSAPYALLDEGDLKENAVVCDVSIPKNIYGESIRRKDVTIIPGGLIKLPIDTDFGRDIYLPKNVSYGCVAETILLSLEGMFECYSLGANIDLERIDKIGKVAVKHGFLPWIGS